MNHSAQLRPVVTLLAGIMLLAVASTSAQADVLLWNVTSPTSAGPPFPALSSVHIDVGPAPPPGSIPDGGVVTIQRTHAADITLEDVITSAPLSTAQLVASDSNPLGYADRATFDLRVGNTSPELIPVPINWLLRFDFQPDVGGSLAGHISPDFIPVVQFDDTSFRVEYRLNLAGFINPDILPIQLHTLAGHINPELQPTYRIAGVEAVIGSLDLSLTLEPLSTTPISGDETTLISMTLQGTAVPEPSSFVLAALGLIGLVVWGWRRRLRREATSSTSAG